MKRLFIRFFSILTLFSAIILLSNAQSFDGNYILQTPTGTLSLQFKKETSGSYSGILSGNGSVFQLKGTVTKEILTGPVGDPSTGIFFKAAKQGEQLVLNMYETDQFNQPVLATAQTLIFSKQELQTSGQEIGGAVIINGETLTEEQLKSFELQYGQRPGSGNFWYDSQSGLYGVIGYPSYGFMYPGHDFGALKSDASNGNTGVIINNRQIPQLEWLVWSYIIGSWIQPGRYWLDKDGNAGYEGSSIVLINLYAAARENTYNGKGGEGNNFWSTRFSAGNSNTGNTQGYVSVPGYGPVGYGFN